MWRRDVIAFMANLFAVMASASSPMPDLVPKPAHLIMREGAFWLGSNTVLVAPPGAEVEARNLAISLRASTGFGIPLAMDRPARDYIALELDRAQGKLGLEGYSLSVAPAGISIRAAAPAGLFYGGITLRQLPPPEALSTGPAKLPAAPGAWKIPCVEIEDTPRFPWRGLLIDVARHYMPVEFLKKEVDLLSLHKMNRLQLHLTDDQGWRIEIKKYPRLTEIGSVRAESPLRGDRNRGDSTRYGPFFYSQEELRSLVAYAEARHVTIVPEIEMPGHFMAALAAYPEFSCRGGPFEVRTRWGIERDILCAGNDASIAFALDVLTEVLELFPSPFIHIGGDEAPRDRWKECPQCQARMRAEGLKSEAELQTYFNHRVERFLADGGRRMIGWDEILDGGLTPGAAVMSWRGTAGGIAAANAGHDVVMSPTSHCYFDYAQSRKPSEPESIGGFIPLSTVYAFEPIPPGISDGQRSHILGGQGNVWTEYLPAPKDVEYFAYPRALALAEVLWSSAEGRDYNEFSHRLKAECRRLDQLHVNYRHLDELTPVMELPGQ